MTRPAFITDAQIAAWRAELPPLPPHLPPKVEEITFAGQWLGEQLVLAGIEESRHESTCFALGQLSASRDPWKVAQLLLEDARRAVFYPSGAEMAAAIAEGKMSDRFGLGGEMQTWEEAKAALAQLHQGTPREFIRKWMKRYGAKTLSELKTILERELAKREPQR